MLEERETLEWSQVQVQCLSICIIGESPGCLPIEDALWRSIDFIHWQPFKCHCDRLIESDLSETYLVILKISQQQP